MMMMMIIVQDKAAVTYKEMSGSDEDEGDHDLW